MYLLYCDESNLEEKDHDFFIYGGIVIEAASAHSLSLEIDKIRQNAKIPSDFLLKLNPGPAHLNHQEFIEVKEAVIKAAVSHKCIFLTSLILHNIATSPDDARRNEINRICYHYDCFLNRPKCHGLVLIDRFEDKKIDSHLREKFSTGITGLPYTPTARLERIVGLHYAAIGQSHFGSVIDIVLGSFRFAVNAFTRGDKSKTATAKHLLELLSPLFFRENSKGEVSEISLFFSPKIITAKKYRDCYHSLSLYLAENNIVAAQEISGERRY